MKKLTWIGFLFGSLLLCSACANIDGQAVREILEATIEVSSGEPDEATIASGLREALQVGTERAVGHVSARDGYWGNELIRIAMPEELEEVASILRRIGFSQQVDEVEVGMNRAAEQAAVEAVDVFWLAIQQMTLEDVYGIYRGGDHAATEYFQQVTSEELRARYSPIVQDKMAEVGLVRAYSQLMGRYSSLPLMDQVSFDLEGYVIDQALSGLFSTLAEEEARIRQDPAARTTELLRRVFSQ